MHRHVSSQNTDGFDSQHVLPEPLTIGGTAAAGGESVQPSLNSVPSLYKVSFVFSVILILSKRALGCTRCGRYSLARACNGALRAACNMGMRRLAKTNQVYAHMVIWCALGNSSSPSLQTLFFLIIFSLAKLFFGKKRNSIGIYVIGWQHAQHCRPASPLLQYGFRCLAVFFMRIFLASRPSLHLCVSTLCALKSPQYSRSPFPPIIYPIYPTYSRSTHIANFPTC